MTRAHVGLTCAPVIAPRGGICRRCQRAHRLLFNNPEKFLF
jgi:hypothetical protein